MRSRLYHSRFAVWAAIMGMALVMGVACASFAGTETVTKEAKETLEATKQYTIEQKEGLQLTDSRGEPVFTGRVDNG